MPPKGGVALFQGVDISKGIQVNKYQKVSDVRSIDAVMFERRLSLFEKKRKYGSEIIYI